MVLVRLASAVAVAAAVILTSTASAARVSCQLVFDSANDVDRPESPVRVGPPPVVLPQLIPERALDILSADVAADANRVTTVVRVSKLAATSPTYSPSGMEWSFSFSVGTTAFTFTAQADRAGSLSYQASSGSGGLTTLYPGGVRGVFDTRRNEVRITAPLSLLAGEATIKPGTELSKLHASTARFAAIPNSTGRSDLGRDLVQVTMSPSDQAGSRDTYVVGKRSCVALGK